MLEFGSGMVAITRSMFAWSSRKIAQLGKSASAIAILCCASSLSCDKAPSPVQLDPLNLKEAQDPRAFIDTRAVWDSANPLVVCWRGEYRGRDKEMTWVRESLESSWSRHANVRFVGWRPCNETKGRIDIPISVEDAGPHVLGLGSNILRMLLNFDFQKWGCGDRACSFSETRRKEVIQSIAIHEFGHALGLSHEQNRPDTPASCDQPAQGPDGDLDFGEWDSISVMNYCNPTTGVRLSQTDINAVQFMYGARSAFVIEGERLRPINDPASSLRVELQEMPINSEWLTGDLDGDGNDELLSIQSEQSQAQQTQTLRTYAKFEDLLSPIPLTQRLTFEQSATQQQLADVNGDGQADYLSVRPAELGALIFMHPALGNLSFVTEPEITVTFSPNVGAQYLFGDINADGSADMVQIEPDLTGARIITREAKDGRFLLNRSVSTLQLQNAPQTRWLLGDITGDDRDDLVRITPRGSISQICVHRAQSQGQFSPRPRCADFPAVPAKSQQLLADFDGDGRKDLIHLHGVKDRTHIEPWLSDGISLVPGQQSYPSLAGYWQSQQWLPLRAQGEARANYVGLW